VAPAVTRPGAARARSRAQVRGNRRGHGQAPGRYLAEQAGVIPLPVPVPWYPNWADWPALTLPL
jgi:hypothetical protein